MKDNKKNLIFYFAIAIITIILLAIVFYQFKISNKQYGVVYDIKAIESKYNNSVRDITEGTEIGQTFESKINNLAAIYINFYKDSNDTIVNQTGGNAIIGLKDEESNIIYEEQISYNYIRTNNNYKFEFPMQKDSENKKYYLYIKFLNLEDNYKQYFTVNCSNEDVYKDGSMYINNEEVDGDIYFQEHYYDKNSVILFAIVSIFITAILLCIAIKIYKSKNLTPEKLFLYLMPVICILSFFIMPILKSHDEAVHWYRIFDIAQGHPFTQMIQGEPKADVPREMYDIQIHSNPKELNYSDFGEQINYTITDDSQRLYITLATTAIYNPISYLPQSIGAVIAKIITSKPILIAYGARLVNMLLTLVLLYFAIKIIPYGKKILLLLACIPISVECFTSMSPDALTISIAFLFTAYVLKLFNEKDKKINIKDKILLLIMAIVIALCKIVYLPLVALVLILPKEKFKSRKEQITTIGLIIGIAIVANLLWLLISASYLSTFRGGDSKIQLTNLLKNPIQYIQMLFHTFNVEAKDYLFTMFGGQLGWDEYINIYSLVPIAFGSLFIFFAISDNDIKNKFNTYQKIIMILIILAISALIFTSLYIQWTPVTYDIISGVQGRYFIPIIPIVALAILSMVKIKNEYKEESKLKTLGIMVLLLYVYVLLSIVSCNF